MHEHAQATEHGAAPMQVPDRLVSNQETYSDDLRYKKRARGLKISDPFVIAFAKFLANCLVLAAF